MFSTDGVVEHLTGDNPDATVDSHLMELTRTLAALSEADRERLATMLRG
ncbi:MAG: hypothetical protein AB7I48_15720 [Planctomycetaceae bacterium]